VSVRAGWRTALVVLTVAGAVALCVVAQGGFGDDGETVVPAPEAADRAAAVLELSRAAAVQDVCYGWRLTSSTRTVSVGSNLGDGTPVSTADISCPRWIEVQANVVWTPESSESADTANVDIRSSNLLGGIPASGLERFGLAGVSGLTRS
jgi:hypothetical protein